MHLVFSPTCVEVEKIFNNLAFLYIWTHQWRPGIVEPWFSQFWFLLTKTRFTQNMLVTGLTRFFFQKKLKMYNYYCTVDEAHCRTHDDRRRPIAVGQLSNSGDLEIFLLIVHALKMHNTALLLNTDLLSFNLIFCNL